MRRIFALVLFLCLASACVLPRSIHAQTYGKAQGWCEQGNQAVVTNSLSSTTRVQRSYPSCTVTVYDSGTLNLATIFSDSAGTAKANPFTAASDGRWFFYADNNWYDVKFSGSGLTPFTSGDIPVAPRVNFEGSGTTNYIPKFTGTTTIGNSTVVDNGTYVIVGIGTTDANITPNALIIGSSTNVGDLLITRTSPNSNALRFNCTTDPLCSISSDRTGSGTYSPLIFYTNNSEALRLSTDSFLQLTDSFTGASPLSAVGTVALRNNAGTFECSQNGGAWVSCVAGGVSGTTNRLSKFTSASTVGNSNVADNGTYIIVGTGTTDASITPNALVVGSSANVGDLLITRTSPNSNALRLNCDTSPLCSIASDRTGAGTYSPLVVYTNNTERMRVQTDGTVSIGTATDTAHALNVVGNTQINGNIDLPAVLTTIDTGGAVLIDGIVSITGITNLSSTLNIAGSTIITNAGTSTTITVVSTGGLRIKNDGGVSVTATAARFDSSAPITRTYWSYSDGTDSAFISAGANSISLSLSAEATNASLYNEAGCGAFTGSCFEIQLAGPGSVFLVDEGSSATTTNLWILHNSTLKNVTTGGVDSCSAGFRCLVVTN